MKVLRIVGAPEPQNAFFGEVIRADIARGPKRHIVEVVMMQRLLWLHQRDAGQRIDGSQNRSSA